MEERRKTVMVFGVFDFLHDGHRHFLREAKKLGGRLVAVVASETAVLKLKGRMPRLSLGERTENLSKENVADRIISGDSEPGSWRVIFREKPDIVALGYDQRDLEKELRLLLSKGEIRFRLVSLKPLGDGSLHSSKLM